MIYLDYAATTPVDPSVAAVITEAMANAHTLANPSAVHLAGRQSAALSEAGVETVASLLGCAARDLILTSGATEADNLAIQGVARWRADRGRHLVTSRTEHKAVTDVFSKLEREGFTVSWLTPDANGLIQIDAVREVLRDDTQLVSIMHVNNETGVIQDIAGIGEMLRERDILFHVDAAQSVGKLDIDLESLPVDLMSIAAHKFYGPKGIGALYVADRPGCQLEPLFYGGGQQRGRRPGTLPVPLILGFAKAAEIAMERMTDDLKHVTGLHDRLLTGLQQSVGLHVNSHPQSHYPGILNVSIDAVEGESLLLGMEPVCVATGSACNSRNQEPSYVLRALGLSDAQAQSAVRFSFGRFTTEQDIDAAIDAHVTSVARLRALKPRA